MSTNPMGKSKLPEMYDKLKGRRSAYLDRAQEYSVFTLPYLYPEVTPRDGEVNQHGFQSIGAQAVNHLANKLVMTLFPPQRSFFKLEVTDEIREAMEGGSIKPDALGAHLGGIERRANTLMDEIASRAALSEFFRQLLVGGNSLLRMPEKGNMQAIPFDTYVITRNMKGLWTNLIICEEKEFDSLPPDVQDKVRLEKPTKYKVNKSGTCETKAKLYTQVKRDGDSDMFILNQAVDDVKVGKPDQRVKESALEFIPVTWSLAYGEDYGRGLVEDYAGDFFVVDYLSEAMAKGAVVMTDIKYLLKQGSTIDLDRLINSPSGEVLYGNRDDIGVLQVEKQADFRYISEFLEEYKRRIGSGFMLSSANRRDAERVTTYELRIDANELETSLGGIYSRLAQSLQRPLAYLLLGRINKMFGKDEVNPVILTGIEALGRINDLDKIMQFSQMMQLPATWPQDLQSAVDWDAYSRRVANTLSMDTDFLKTQEELAQEQKKQQEAEAMQNLASEASKAAPSIIEQQVGGQTSG